MARLLYCSASAFFAIQFERFVVHTAAMFRRLQSALKGGCFISGRSSEPRLIFVHNIGVTA